MSRKSPNVTPVTLPDVAAYVAADRSGKSNIRSTVESAMRDAIAAGDLPAAMAADARLRAYADAVASSRTAPAPDYAARIAVRIVTLRDAADALASGAIVPDGIPTDAIPTPDAIAAAIESATVDTTDRDRIARRSVGRSASRHDLRATLADVIPTMADAATYVSVTAIRSAVGHATDGAYVPSPGAIRAAIESDTGVPGVVPVPATDARPFGARIAR